jgi:hypothetical protein
MNADRKVELLSSMHIIFCLLPDSLKTQKKLAPLTSILDDEECLAAITSSIEQKFRNETTNPKMLLSLARFTQEFQHVLKLHEEHFVAQQAIEILSADAVVGEKNPFSLHKRLLALAKEPLNFQPPEVEIAGKRTAFCLERLQASGKAFYTTREQLPRDATKEAWQQLINGLKTKIETNARAKEHLEAVYTPWQTLWESSLSDPYFSGLLELSSEEVSIPEAQLRAILHWLLLINSDIREGEIFSEREETLIKLGISIQHCTTGKKEGIALAYAQLPIANRYQAQGLQGETPEEVTAKKFFVDFVQKMLSEQFSGTNALMQELVGTTDVQQVAHHTIYLKNLIGQCVGLPHKVTFDQHAGLLYDKLIARSREEVLEIFFRHMTPNILVQALMKEVNSNWRHYQKFLEPFSSKEQVSSGWDWDDDLGIPTKLNTLGALHLLQAAGYLKT